MATLLPSDEEVIRLETEMIELIKSVLKQSGMGKKKALVTATGDESILARYRRFLRTGRIQGWALLSIIRELREKAIHVPIATQEKLFELHQQHWKLVAYHDRRTDPWHIAQRATSDIDGAQFLANLEISGITPSELLDPEMLVAAMEKLTAPLKENNDLVEVARLQESFMRAFYARNNPLEMSERARAGAISYIGQQFAWTGLQMESLKIIKDALHVVNSVYNVNDMATVVALNTIKTYKERVSHLSSLYPNVDYAQKAYKAVRHAKEPHKRIISFEPLIRDPLIEYSASNELRLLNQGMDQKVQIFDDKTLEEQMRDIAEYAISSGKIEEYSRIYCSIVRGLCNEGRIRDADMAASGLPISVPRGWSKATEANIFHAKGILEGAKGKIEMAVDYLGSAAKIYQNLGANNRKNDVFDDLGKIMRDRRP